MQSRYWKAALLGVLGLVLHVLRASLIPGTGSELTLGDAPPLVAFLALGPGPGSLAALLALPGLLWDSPAPWAAAAHPVGVACAWLLVRRSGSLVLSMALYWMSLGALLDGAVYGLSMRLPGWAVGALLVQRAASAILAAAIAEFALGRAAVYRALGAPPPPPMSLERHLRSRLMLMVLAPTLAAGLGYARLSSSSPERLLEALDGPLVTTLVVGLLLYGVATALSHRLTGPLRRLRAAVRDVETGGFAGASALADLAASPIEEARGLADGLVRMHDALAYYDPVTGLPNVRLLLDRVGLAVAQGALGGGSFALFHVDLDRFRVVDGSVGREAANDILAEIARRFEECVRRGDTVARVGGDEFGLLVPGIDSMDTAATLAVKVMDSLKRPFRSHRGEIVLTATVGVSLFPRDGVEAEVLLKNATAATYAAKESGQDNYRRYSARLSAKESRRLAIESGLRLALKRGELRLRYQPLVDLRSGRIHAVEALLRWTRQDSTEVSPSEFVPIAETSGLISAIDAWVMTTACREVAGLGLEGIDLVCAINLSARQFQEPDLVERVRGALERTELRPERLELEITEGVAMRDPERALETLLKLRELGVSVSVDDFGTGYSSLSYLKRFPVSSVKLDQSFVSGVTTDPDDAAISRAVIAMAHSLRLKVVAEGIETLEQLAFLEREGCDLAQGFLLSPPVPIETLLPLLQRPSILPGRPRAG